MRLAPSRIEALGVEALGVEAVCVEAVCVESNGIESASVESYSVSLRDGGGAGKNEGREENGDKFEHLMWLLGRPCCEWARSERGRVERGGRSSDPFFYSQRRQVSEGPLRIMLGAATQ